MHSTGLYLHPYPGAGASVLMKRVFLATSFQVEGKEISRLREEAGQRLGGMAG